MVKYLLEIGGVFITENRAKECALAAVDVFVIESVKVPCHVEECLHGKLHGLYVAYVKQPIAVGTCVVSLFQLLIHQHGGGGVEPQIIMRSAEIGHMIVDSGTAFAKPVGGVAQHLDVAVVVIGPYESHVVGDFQSAFI